MPSITTSAGSISYTTTGTGPPIILLHATLHTSEDYTSILPTLSLHHQSITLDFPFHGNSSHPSTLPPSALLFASILPEILTSLNLPPAVLIGNSVGGFAAARLAITHPDKVAGLILVNSGGFVPWTPWLRTVTRVLGIEWVNRLLMPSLVWRYMAPQNAIDKGIAERVSARAKTGEGARVSASIWRSFLAPEYDLRGRAEEVKVKTLLVWGKRDLVIPVSVGVATEKVIRGSRLEVLDAGHVVFASRPEEFLGVVLPFVDECFRGEGGEG